MFISLYAVNVLSLDVVIVDELDVLDERSLFRSPGNQLVVYFLICKLRFSMCGSIGDSFVSLLILLLELLLLS